MNQSRIKRVVLAVAICIVIILLLLWYASALGNILSAGTRTQMQEFARQNALTVRTEMESQITSLAEISERIADLEEPLRPPLASEAENLSVIDVKRAVELLKEILPRYSFKRMGIAVPNGTAYTTDGYEMDLSKREYFTQSMQ